MTHSKNPTLCVAVALMLAGIVCAATDIEFSAQSGYDSNPFRLSASQGSWFERTDVESKFRYGLGKYERLTLKLDGYAVWHERSNANRYQFRTELEWSKRRLKLAGRRTDLKIEADYIYRDSTYVSRSTGDVATSGGQEIGDRFDSHQWSLNGEIETALTEQWSVELELHTRYKNYRRDYNSLGLERLDYWSFGLDTKIVYEPNRHRKVFVDGGISRRHYVDRRADDRTGTALPDSDLKYEYLTASVGATQQLSPAWTASVELDAELRYDNEDGFADRERHKIEVELAYESGPWRVELEAAYSHREYMNGVPDTNDTNTGGRRRFGHRVSARATHALRVSGRKAAIFAELRSERYHNSNTTFTFDRQLALVGFEVGL